MSIGKTNSDKIPRALFRAADAAGYAMASREEDLLEVAVLQPEVALRNGHASAARAVRRMSIPFAKLADVVANLFALSDLSRPHTTRALLTSR